MLSADRLSSLLTVVAATVDTSGVLLEANAGFLRFFRNDDGGPLGTRVTATFSRPTFDSLLAMPDQGGADIYHGLMTLEGPLGMTRTLRGSVWRVSDGVRVLAEYDIVELERTSELILNLNQEGSVERDTLARANVTLKQRQAEVLEVSLTDQLTGVGNRRKLEQALAVEISRSDRYEADLSALMVDIDHFKLVNDTFGHPAGDRVIAQLAALLRSQTRPTDTVARFGGEEFVVLMPYARLEHALAKADKIRAMFEHLPIDPVPHPVTASFGVAELEDHEDSVAFIARLDAALYAAKSAGRNRVVAAERTPRPPA